MLVLLCNIFCIIMLTGAFKALMLGAPPGQQAARLRLQGGDKAWPATQLRHSVPHDELPEERIFYNLNGFWCSWLFLKENCCIMSNMPWLVEKGYCYVLKDTSPSIWSHVKDHKNLSRCSISWLRNHSIPNLKLTLSLTILYAVNLNQVLLFL